MKILIKTLYGRTTSTGTTDCLIPAGLKIPEACSKAVAVVLPPIR
jgi:hypothetical protein